MTTSSRPRSRVRRWLDEWVGGISGLILLLGILVVAGLFFTGAGFLVAIYIALAGNQ